MNLIYIYIILYFLFLEREKHYAHTAKISVVYRNGAIGESTVCDLLASKIEI